MVMNKWIGERVLSEEQIQLGVQTVASMLNEKFDEIVVITVVPGGILFSADLVRQLTMGVKMDYLSCPHTPGDRHNASEIVFHDNVGLAGQHVVLVDDAIESGGTMKRVVEHIMTHYPVKSLCVATLFVKPGRVSIAVPQYYAYELEKDELLVGYGLPWQDKLRNIPYISRLVQGK